MNIPVTSVDSDEYHERMRSKVPWAAEDNTVRLRVRFLEEVMFTMSSKGQVEITKTKKANW